MPTSIASRLSPVDLAIVALYLVAITIFGLRFSKKSGKRKRSLKSYFLADNTIPWWAIALSIVSAETSTLTIVSIPGVAFAGDMGFLQIVLGYMLGRVVVALLFLPRYFRGEMLTAYQLIDRRFGPVLHKVTAGLFLLTRAAAEGVRVFAISIVVSIAIGTGDTLSIAIISGLTLLYTFEGGLAAVIWTDVVQMALYVAGTVVALATLGAHIPGGWSHIHAVAAPLGKFHVFNFALNLTQSYTFWAGILGGTFLTMASHGTDQLMVQRMLAARNLRESRLALLSSGVVILLQFTLFLLIGIGLFVFYGTHPTVFRSNDYIFPSFIVHEMPHGVAGLLVAAILAAAMSNLSAALNSLASTTVIDFYMPLRRWLSREPTATARDDGSERERTLVARASTVFWAVVLFAIAVYSIQHGGKGHVVETGLSIASVAYGCLLGVFLLGTLTRYATQTGAIVGMICGFALNLSIWQASLPRPFLPLNIPHIAFTWYVLIGALVTFAIGSLFSFILPKRRALAAALLLISCLSFRSEAQGPALPFSAPHHQSVILSEAPRGLMRGAQSKDPEAASSATSASPSQPQPFDFTPVSALIIDAIAKKQLPGAVLSIGHNGQVVFHRAYGNRAVEPAAEAMTEDTLFDMASLSKVLSTTVAVLQLEEQGKLELDAPVARYLPDFAANGKEAITIRELMTHYSGLPEDVSLKDGWGLATPDKAEGIRRAMASVPYGPPGVMFKYSDINFITLGYLVETLSGQTLDAYASEHIFAPLGMSSTAYHPFDRTCGPATRTGSAISPGPKPVGRIGVACVRGTWSPYALDPTTAPTAHDDESKASPAANPDFDRILRGTVHDPTTRRMGGVAGHAGVFSTAADTATFCQALLDKLLRNTGPFPLSQATLKLATSPNEPATAITTATIFTPDGQPTKGVASRGLGWDLNTAFSRPRGAIFPISTRGHQGSFGHTGFTGTSLWIDPTSDTYVVMLANAIHPRGAPPISALRGQVATATARALGLGEAFPSPAPAASGASSTMTGIDVLEATNFAGLKTIAAGHGGHLKLALLTNQSGIDAHSRRTIDILLHADPSLELTTLYTPEHGLFAAQDTEHLASETDPATHLPVVSFYGPKPSDKRPSPAQLAAIDAIVIDLQDVGVRFWTYETILGYFLEATACTGTEVIVLDRPNPNGGLQVGGPVSDPGVESYTDYMPIPARNGMTFGELAKYFRATHPCASAKKPGGLTVIPMQHWTRDEFFTDTQLPWIPPSPNMKTPATAVVYPGVAFIEGTNVSVGRGTAAPYENFGSGLPAAPKPCPPARPCLAAAPPRAWFRGSEVAAYLNARNIPGIAFSAVVLPIAVTPEHYPFAGQTIEAVHLTVTDRALLDTSELGLEILSALHRLYPVAFQLDHARGILANAAALESLRQNRNPRDIAADWQPALTKFKTDRQQYLLYP